MSNNPTAEDAKIIMQLYDLRREAEMRKARKWFAGWWPRSADDIVQVIQAGGTQENAWFRQVSGYWDMAASFVLRGVLNEDLFFDSSAELWFMFAKVQPFLNELRQKTSNAMLYTRIEKVATQTEPGRERMQSMAKRADAMRAKASTAN